MKFLWQSRLKIYSFLLFFYITAKFRTVWMKQRWKGLQKMKSHRVCYHIVKMEMMMINPQNFSSLSSFRLYSKRSLCKANTLFTLNTPFTWSNKKNSQFTTDLSHFSNDFATKEQQQQRLLLLLLLLQPLLLLLLVLLRRRRRRRLLLLLQTYDWTWSIPNRSFAERIQNRFWPLCNSNQVEDEIHHFFSQCKKYLV